MRMRKRKCKGHMLGMEKKEFAGKTMMGMRVRRKRKNKEKLVY